MRRAANMANNAAAPIEQIERVYARHLPISAATAINLLTFCAARLQGATSFEKDLLDHHAYLLIVGHEGVVPVG